MTAELVFEGAFLGGGLVFFWMPVFDAVFFADDRGFVLLFLGILVKVRQ